MRGAGYAVFRCGAHYRRQKAAVFVLENVKNLKSHDKGRTFAVIMTTLDELGYDVADAGNDSPDAKIIDARHFLPQHRERIVLVGIRRDYAFSKTLSLRQIQQHYPPAVPSLQSLLKQAPEEKYILSKWNQALGESDFNNAANMARRPRRLSPRECACLMGFEAPGEQRFRIPVSDTQAYKQFGNSVVVPVFAAVAQLLLPCTRQLIRHNRARV